MIAATYVFRSGNTLSITCRNRLGEFRNTRRQEKTHSHKQLFEILGRTIILSQSHSKMTTPKSLTKQQHTYFAFNIFIKVAFSNICQFIVTNQTKGGYLQRPLTTNKAVCIYCAENVSYAMSLIRFDKSITRLSNSLRISAHC